MHADGFNGPASGFVCPDCGGALWEQRDGHSLRFECRIGDAFSAVELWIRHCAMRNGELKRAARVLAENAALARKLAEWTRERGNDAATLRLLEEAADDERLFEQVSQLLDGLSGPDTSSLEDVEAE